MALYGDPWSRGVEPPAQRGLLKDTRNPIWEIIASLMQRPQIPGLFGESPAAPPNGAWLRDAPPVAQSAQATTPPEPTPTPVAAPSAPYPVPPSPTEGDVWSPQPSPLDDPPLPRPRPAEAAPSAAQNPWQPSPSPLAPQASGPPPAGGYLDDPRVRSALLSFGLSMMQPPSFGDNFASQFGRSVGTAGEAVDRNEAMDLKQEEAASKQDLRGAQAESQIARAGAAEARAATSGARNETSTARLALAGREQELRHERSLNSLRVRVSRDYQQSIAPILKKNAKEIENAAFNPGKPPKLEPVPTYPDWVRNHPSYKNLGLIDEPTGEDAPDADPTTFGGAQDAPTDPAKRAVGGVYMTPKGELEWTGTGWIQPKKAKR